MLIDLDDEGKRAPRVRFQGAVDWIDLQPGDVLPLPGGNFLSINDDRSAEPLGGFVLCALSGAFIAFVLAGCLFTLYS